jgi:hypothetical protein
MDLIRIGQPDSKLHPRWIDRRREELGTSGGGESLGPTSCRRVLEGERSAMMAPARRKNREEEGRGVGGKGFVATGHHYNRVDRERCLCIPCGL